MVMTDPMVPFALKRALLSVSDKRGLVALASALHQQGRSTFFLTLQNLNVLSGIASPPNAMAII